MKSKGDRGSPCRSPLPCRIESRGMPFNMTCEVEVASRAEIQFCQLVSELTLEQELRRLHKVASTASS
jgi:hypothetical protein